MYKAVVILWYRGLIGLSPRTISVASWTNWSSGALQWLNINIVNCISYGSYSIVLFTSINLDLKCP